MSYILDALKKVEYEKNRKKLSDGRVSISGDLFQENRQPVKKARLWKVATLVTVITIFVCVGTWYVLQVKSNVARPVRPPVPAPAVSVVTVPGPTVSERPAQPLAPAASSPLSVNPVPSENQKKPVAGYSPENNDRDKRLQTKGPASSGQAVVTVQAPVDIKLSGIAWQDDRAGRRAVINGFLLKEGSVISGARVTDIHADKVRFSSASGVFEVKLDAVLPVEDRK